MAAPPDPVRAIYDSMWERASAAFDAGRVEADPHLRDRASDTRRGVTLLIRPAPDAIAAINGVLDDLRAFAPDQHFYAPDELHITVLSIISCAPDFDLDAVPLDRYRTVFESVIPPSAPFTISYTGLTASPQAVIASGGVATGDDAAGDALNTRRDRLRTALSEADLGETLDRRYTIRTAHSTILRFQSPPRDLPGLRAYLAARRDLAIVSFAVDAVEFVFNDWYMSRDVVRVLGRYQMGESTDSK